MLITFKSKAAADIIMYEKHAQPILELLGKEVARGVIPAAEMPQAVSRLEAGIEEKRRQEADEQAAQAAQTRRDDEDQEAKPQQGVSFATRAYPLLDMLRAAQKTGADVMWGV